MRFDFLTIFPSMFDSYLNESILKRAKEKKLLSFATHDLRTWTTDKHHTVDDKPYGGGPGMIMKVEPIYRALKDLKVLNKKSTCIILLSAKGKQFSHSDATRLAKKYKRVVFICGRYEGVDERVAEHLADEEFSIGPYVLTGGELPAMVIADAVGRHIPGVLGSSESLLEESHSMPTPYTLQPTTSHEYPQYTRPEIFSPKKGINWRVPKELLSGDPKKISAWRQKHQ